MADGSYTLVCLHSDVGLYDLSQPVEGMRGGWQDRLVSSARHLTPEARAGFVYALRMLAVAEVMPPAYERSLPVLRFQDQLRRVLGRVE